MNRRVHVFLMPVLCLVLAACAGGRYRTPAGGWQFLGERTVHGRVDTDVIPVTAREGAFKEIQFEVRGSALEMYDVNIVFGNGENYSPPTRLVFGRGGSSRNIDLPGGDRVIRRIEFRYGNLPRGGRARVKVFGR